MDHKIFIIVPVFNEERTIATVLNGLISEYLDAKIIVVDDGSFDNTANIIANISHQNLIKIRNEKNSGKGSAMITGLNYIENYENGIVVFSDSDLEINVNQIKQVINAYQVDNTLDAVFGSRFLNKDNFKIYGFKFVINYLLTTLSNSITSNNLTDMETALKSFKTSLIKRLNLKSSGFDIEPEIVYKLGKLNIKIHEVPIEYTPRGKAEGKKCQLREG